MGIGLLIFVYCICAYGMSNMMVFSSGPFHIFEHIRNISSSINEHFGSLFQCMICFPANLGWICSLIDWFLIKDVAITPFNIILAGTNLWWVALIADCCFTTGIVWLIHNFESFFESIAKGSETEIIEEPDEETINVHE